MRPNNAFFDFIFREWLLFAAALGLAATSIYLKRVPVFSVSELEVLLLLWLLFTAGKGLENSGIMLRFSQRVERGRLVPLKLVLTTFALSALVTNDMALVVVVPLTLALNTTRKDILVILEAFAANAGAALTPFGNPQNLYIYWYYRVGAADFIASIAPFSLFFLLLLIAASILVRTKNDDSGRPERVVVRKTVYIYVALLTLLVLTVLRVLPLAAGLLVLAYALIFDRKALRVDYFLLAAFLFFFGLAENMKLLLATRLEHTGHIFIFSALSSQVMSNVPAALLFAKFTGQWKALLWGTNVGGFGNLVASFANLIAYKFYITHETESRITPFTIKFIGLGFVMFLVGMGLYWTMEAHSWAAPH